MGNDSCAQDDLRVIKLIHLLLVGGGPEQNGHHQ